MTKARTRRRRPAAEVEANPDKVLRDEEGHLLPGSAPINPLGAVEVRKRHYHYLQLMEEAVSDEDVKKIVRRAVTDAKNGDRWARDFLFHYLVGKPSVVPSSVPREAPMFRLLKTWLLAELASGKLEIKELSAELSGVVPVLAEKGEE